LKQYEQVRLPASRATEETFEEDTAKEAS